MPNEPCTECGETQFTRMHPSGRKAGHMEVTGHRFRGSTTVRAHPRRGTRGVRRHLRWVLPKQRTQLTSRSGQPPEPFADEEIRYMDPRTVLLRNFTFHPEYLTSRSVRDSDTYRWSKARLERGLPLDPPLLAAVDRKTGYAEVADGQRRLFAAMDLGMKRVPVVVRYS